MGPGAVAVPREGAALFVPESSLGIAQNGGTGALCQSSRHDWHVCPVRWRTLPVRCQMVHGESCVSTNRGETDERPSPALYDD
jgi:hypothetical protein